MQVPDSLFDLAGICLISKTPSNRTGNNPVQASIPSSASACSPPPSFLQPVRSRLPRHSAIVRNMRHLRGLLRLARRRPAFGLALLLGSASVAGTVITATTAATMQAIHRRTEHRAPLATAKPLAPPPSFFTNALPKPPHHLLAALHTNPLRGLASWYGSVLHGHKTASGDTFEEAELTAAHRSLPFGTLVRVTDLGSMRSVVVRINDRGVLAPDRVIDLSSAAAQELGILRTGLARVKLEILQRPVQS